MPREGEARPVGWSQEGTKVQRKDRVSEKQPSIIYSLSLTFLQVLIMKMQPTALHIVIIGN